MDNREARDLLAKELERYRSETWEQLQRLLTTCEKLEVKGTSGTTYQIGINAVWDDWGSGGDLRVMGSIDDMTFWRAIRPLCDDFIMAPDGSFVGEPARATEGHRGAEPGPVMHGGAGKPWVALVLGFLVILAGLAQAGADEEFFPRFHYPLLNVAFGIPPVVLGLLAINARERATRSPFLLRHAGAVSAIFLAGALGTQWLLECVVREERFDMTWSLETYKLRAEDRTGVRLEFADHPGWTTDIASKDLADYLTTLGSRRVPVVIRVVRDFGRLREFKVVQVAERRDWTYNDHGGWTGYCGWMYAPAPVRTGVGPAPIR